jgi:transposase, IS5 family
VSVFLRFEIPVWRDLCDWVVGHQRWGDAVARQRDDRKKDLLRSALEEIIDLGHPLVRLAGEIDWGFLDRRFASVCAPGPGQPGLPTRRVAGAVPPQAHSQPVGRDAVRTLAGVKFKLFND